MSSLNQWWKIGVLLMISQSTVLAHSTYAPPADLQGDDILQRCRRVIKESVDIQSQINALEQKRRKNGDEAQKPGESEGEGDEGLSALELYNEILILMNDISNESGLVAQVHPNETIRHDAEICEQEASKFLTDLSLDNDIYQAIDATNRDDLDEDGMRMLTNTLRDFKRSGVDKDEATREKIKAIKEELVQISQQFEQNISSDVFSIELNREQDLDGLPRDYIEAHRTATGKFVITTAYPDFIPFMKYAKNGEARRELRFKFLNRGEKNGPVLTAMIQKRHELARLLGYESYADYVMEDKMIKSTSAVYDFLDNISSISTPGADREFQELLLYKRRTDATAATIEGYESAFLEEGYKKERYGFDSQIVRPYFPYRNVRDGLMRVTGELFNIRYEKIDNASVWHESVETYDVYDETGKLGRIHLDMHPREGKFSHAAQFTARSGIAGRQYPEGVLVCNFPDPREGDGSALMEHGDVVTFFHEFGHLLHHVFAGRQQWAPFSGVATEWDFVEAPSQLLEEWAWSPEVLATFAHHYLTNEPIPEQLVKSLRAAEEFGKAMSVRQQMFYAAISVNFYHLDPASFDPVELMKALEEEYSYFPHQEGTHFIYSFGHLDDYSAVYYTYMWSLSLAKDLFEPFKTHGIMNRATADRYRDRILAPGGSHDAIKLVEDFLERPFSFDAFEKWLTSEEVL